MQWSSHLIATIDNQQSRAFLKHLYKLIVDKKDITPDSSRGEVPVENKIQTFNHILISKTLVMLHIHAAKVFKEISIPRSAFSRIVSDYYHNVFSTLNGYVEENRPVHERMSCSFNITAGVLLNCNIDCAGIKELQAQTTYGKHCLTHQDFLRTLVMTDQKRVSTNGDDIRRHRA